MQGRTLLKAVRLSTLNYVFWIAVAAVLFVCNQLGALGPFYDIVSPPTPYEKSVVAESERYAKSDRVHQPLYEEARILREARHFRAFFCTESAVFVVAGLCYGVLHSREVEAQIAADRAALRSQVEAAKAEREAAERAAKEEARSLASGHAELTAEEFLTMPPSPEFTGVYILHNVSQDTYYVGQSVRVLQRVRQHLTGYGNGDVYADYKYGDDFTVRTISLVDSGYLSIDDLEREMIDAYDALEGGYNRTRGNGGR